MKRLMLQRVRLAKSEQHLCVYVVLRHRAYGSIFCEYVLYDNQEP
jgi:hypothetical protein